MKVNIFNKFLKTKSPSKFIDVTNYGDYRGGPFNTVVKLDNELIAVVNGYFFDTSWRMIEYLNTDKQSRVEIYENLIEIQNSKNISKDELKTVLSNYTNSPAFYKKSYHPYNDLGYSIFEKGMYHSLGYQFVMSILDINDNYLLATQSFTQLNYERILYYYEKIMNGDYLCGICVYLGNNRSVILDGHHRVFAAFLANKKIDMITIDGGAHTDKKFKVDFENNYKNSNTSSKNRNSIIDSVVVSESSYDELDSLKYFSGNEKYLQATIEKMKAYYYNFHISNISSMINELKYLSNFYSYDIFKFFMEIIIDNIDVDYEFMNNYIDNALDYELDIKEYFNDYYKGNDINSLYEHFRNKRSLGVNKSLETILVQLFIKYEIEIKKIEEEM